MGCNYYLIEKAVKSAELALCDALAKSKIKRLYDLYSSYAELDNNCRIHIGKSSIGWMFHLCVYPECGINELDDWKKIFNDKDFIIENEEHKEISPEEMIELIADRGRKGSLHEGAWVKRQEEDKKKNPNKIYLSNEALTDDDLKKQNFGYGTKLSKEYGLVYNLYSFGGSTKKLGLYGSYITDTNSDFS